MKTQPNATADGKLPLPGGQFRGFLLFFHIVFLGMVGFTLYAHLRHVGNRQEHGGVLIGLVALQTLLYLCFFALPSLAQKSPAWKWFRDLLGKVSNPDNPDWPALRWWLFYFVASVALVLAECRIEPAFGWALVAYVGQISSFPFRVSVPLTAAVLGAWLLNQFGWTALASWDFRRWFVLVIQFIPGLAFLLFVGRVLRTSGERGELIEKLKAAQHELELARQRDAELAVLQERERLARDLHDNLGHSLVTLTVQLEAAQRLLATEPGRAGALLAEMQNLTRSSMEDLRRSLANLRARGLGDRRLADALQLLCNEAAQNSAMKIECRLADGTERLPPLVAEALWRVAQEALTNVQKHAQANHVGMDLTLQPKEVRLRVSDDGHGLPPDVDGKPGHYGVRGMRERVEGLGGTFSLAANGHCGTVIEARLPLIT
jgi:signal transduction histidine kinase